MPSSLAEVSLHDLRVVQHFLCFALFQHLAEVQNREALADTGFMSCSIRSIVMRKRFCTS